MITKKKRIVLLTLSMLLILTAVSVIWLAVGNTALELTEYTLSSNELPKEFNGFRIAQVSDLHNAEMGADNERLIEVLKEAAPSIIVITGDMIDSRRTDLDLALNFAKEAVEIAPCYYVTGNHEARVEEYSELKEGLSEIGVRVLEDERVVIERSGQKLSVIGIQDPSFDSDRDYAAVMRQKLSALVGEDDGYTVVLSHRPEHFEEYARSGADLVFCGHVHGGQFRLPIVGGVISPDQSLFPEYDAGVYTKDSTQMVVSRGIGNSIIPLRINNRPEVIVVELSETP